MAKILITGATGFVGSHLTQLLDQEGHELYVLVRNRAKYDQFNVRGKIIENALQIDAPNNWIAELPENIDTVIHIAGLVESYQVEDFYRINATATKQLINDLTNRYSHLHFIYISSLAAAGPGLPSQKIINEEITPHPVSHYGISKLTAEKFIHKYAPKEWNISILRPPMIIGPRDVAMLEVFKMVKGRIIIYEGSNGLDKEYSFISVFDLNSAIAALVNDPHNNDTYFIANPSIITYRQLIEEIADLLKIDIYFKIRIPLFLLISLAFGVKYIKHLLPVKLPITPDKIAEIKQRSWICSGQKLEEHYNLKYQYGLRAILEKSLEDYQQRRWI